jgi:hypothetical protein
LKAIVIKAKATNDVELLATLKAQRNPMQRTATLTTKTRRPLPIYIVQQKPKPLSKRGQRLYCLQKVRDIAEYLGLGWIGLERGKILVTFNGGVYRLLHLAQAEEWMATWLRRNEAGDRSWFDWNCQCSKVAGRFIR